VGITVTQDQHRGAAIQRMAEAIWLLSAAGIAASYTPLFMDPGTVERFSGEDGIFENLTALYLLVSGLTFFLVLHGMRASSRPLRWQERLKQVALLGLGLLLVFAAGEEVSWGQRLFGIETPEAIRAINAQDEITLHNLTIFHDTGLPFLDMRLIQLAFTATLVLGIPIFAVLMERHYRLDVDAIFPVLPLGFGILFIVNFVVQKVAGLAIEARPALYHHPTTPYVEALDEISEHGQSYVLMLCVVAYAVSALRNRANRLSPGQ
jgi:hypothetical protein